MLKSHKMARCPDFQSLGIFRATDVVILENLYTLLSNNPNYLVNRSLIVNHTSEWPAHSAGTLFLFVEHILHIHKFGWEAYKDLVLVNRR